MKNDYLTEKKPLQALLLFALPIIIGNLFQQTYTMVDSAVVGRFVGEQALAAVGASYSLTNVFIFVAGGGGIGASVIVSRYFGAKNYSKMKTAVFTAFLTFLGISILLGGIGLLFGKSIMIWLNTPEDVLDMAVQYLNIYFLGLPFLFMYNVISSMFNALGKSRIPLYFLIFSSLFNIALDVFLVSQMNMGVAGVAWATLIAQGISAVLSFWVFLREMKKLEGQAEKVYDFRELKDMTRIALPSIFQQSTVSIGLMLVQSVVNGFGSQTLAGFSAASRVESFCIVPMLAMGNAMSSYVAQNLGAKKQERVVEGYRVANGLIVFFSVILCVVTQIFDENVIQFFLGDAATEAALATGMGYVRFIGWFYCGIGFKMCADGLLRGAGDMPMFTVANLVNLGLRVSISMIFAPKFGVHVIWWAIPIGWFANWAISYMEYRTGKWRKSLG